jgi:putative ABC transport system permease protein
MMHVAWRILTYEVGRSLLAIGGIFVAILMIFLQLGFYASVPAGGTLLHENLRYDIMLTSSDYVFQVQSANFPRRRVFQALAHPDVASVAPIYMDVVGWIDEAGRGRHEAFLIGFRLEDDVFNVPDVTRQLDVLKRPDTVLVDRATWPMFGRLEVGRVTEMGNRTVTIGGLYTLGLGFMGLGVALASDQNFFRLLPNHSLATANLGLVRLKPGADPDKVARELRAVMSADTRVSTRKEILDYEYSYWVDRTSTGIVFGFGVIVALIVGVVILYQTLSTQVTRQLPQYATLKAMGYSDAYLGGIVLWLALLMAAVAFPPAYFSALGGYSVIHDATKLPIFMTYPRLAAVLALTLVMSAGSAFYSLRALRRADPVDLF